MAPSAPNIPTLSSAENTIITRLPRYRWRKGITGWWHAKYCHGGSHDNNKLKDYSISITREQTHQMSKGHSGLYRRCRSQWQGRRLLYRLPQTQGRTFYHRDARGASQNYAVPCDECHQNFNNGSVHQQNMFPYEDRNGVNPVTGTGTLNAIILQARLIRQGFRNAVTCAGKPE